MAIVNPKNLYSGNAGIFNSTPYTNFAIKQIAEKQAKAEAVDKYFGEQLAKQTSTGMRDQEIPALVAGRNDAQQFYQQNKRNIEDVRRDNGKAYGEMQQKLNQLQQIAAESKYLGGTDKEVFRLNANPETASRILPAMHDAISQHGTAAWIPNPNGKGVIRNDYDPVTNPTGHKSFDVTDIAYSPKPYESKDMQAISDKYWKSIPPDKYNTVNTPFIGADGKPSTTQMMQYQEGVLSDDKSKKAYKGLIDMHDNDPRLQQTVDQGHPFDEMKAEHEAEFNMLNDVNKKMTGKDITTNGELYAAQEYLTHDNPHVTVPKLVTDLTAKTNRAEQFATKKMYLNDALIKGRMNTAQGFKKAMIDYRQAKSNDAQDGILNKYIQNSLDNGSNTTRFKSEDGTVKDVTAGALNINGKHYVGKFVTVPNSIQGDLVTDYKKVDGKDVPVYPDAFYQTDKEIIPVYFDKQRESGSFEIKRTTKPIDLQTYKSYLGKLLLGTKDRGGEVTDEFSTNDGSSNSDTRSGSNVKVSINGKIYQIPKSNLSKMDKDGVPYKVIQ